MHQWLVSAFFRLHRRRQFGQNGYQPLSYQEMADFADRVLRLGDEEREWFFVAMEETDNAVLYDRHMKDKAVAEKMEAERATKPKTRKRN
ncbi:hypothetical protein [Pseudomonas sp.]|uniref:hypothetical protein n=1 Tax=Pseudomonas sp. TaxID=306 RepID=UPI003FD734D7